MADVVLVIEDDPFLLAPLAEALSTEATAPLLVSAPDALRELERGTVPAVIVIDLDIRDGLAVLSRVESTAQDFIPVVAFSSSPRRLLEAGMADEIVMKPFEAEHLCSCVQRVCEQPRGAM